MLIAIKRCSAAKPIPITKKWQGWSDPTTGEVRSEIITASGLQLDRSSVHFSSGLKSHLVEGHIDERQGTHF